MSNENNISLEGNYHRDFQRFQMNNEKSKKDLESELESLKSENRRLKICHPCLSMGFNDCEAVLIQYKETEKVLDECLAKNKCLNDQLETYKKSTEKYSEKDMQHVESDGDHTSKFRKVNELHCGNEKQSDPLKSYNRNFDSCINRNEELNFENNLLRSQNEELQLEASKVKSLEEQNRNLQALMENNLKNLTVVNPEEQHRALQDQARNYENKIKELTDKLNVANEEKERLLLNSSEVRQREERSLSFSKHYRELIGEVDNLKSEKEQLLKSFGELTDKLKVANEEKDRILLSSPEVRQLEEQNRSIRDQFRGKLDEIKELTDKLNVANEEKERLLLSSSEVRKLEEQNRSIRDQFRGKLDEIKELKGEIDNLKIEKDQLLKSFGGESSSAVTEKLKQKEIENKDLRKENDSALKLNQTLRKKISYLEEESRRITAKVELISTMENSNVKTLQTDDIKLKKRCDELTMENGNLKTQLERLHVNFSGNNYRDQYSSLNSNSEVVNLRAEIDDLKKNLKDKSDDVERKQKALNTMKEKLKKQNSEFDVNSLNELKHTNVANLKKISDFENEIQRMKEDNKNLDHTVENLKATNNRLESEINNLKVLHFGKKTLDTRVESNSRSAPTSNVNSIENGSRENIHRSYGGQ